MGDPEVCFCFAEKGERNMAENQQFYMRRLNYRLIGGLLLSWMCGPEIAFVYDPQNQRPVMIDTVPKSRREISCLLVTLFLAAAVLAAGRQ